ncbi:hypothetical protein PRK78_002985 [Emydomyces testavorans]|uniref:RRM domain-containing protein n=1 Tax=Emydomyces testavorans TaxID=2070801 RepID=A0AAF0DFY6_9EURO|nr:hypothetical protein PRK78_002985 [Emydomyces testavorans]
MGDKRKRSQVTGEEDAVDTVEAKKLKSTDDKPKKEQRSSKTKKKEKKRARDEIDEENGVENVEVKHEGKSGTKETKERKHKKEKKREKKSIENGDIQNGIEAASELNGEKEGRQQKKEKEEKEEKKEKKKKENDKKEKKDRKEKKKSKVKKDEAQEDEGEQLEMDEPHTAAEIDTVVPIVKEEEDGDIHPDRKQGRFIVFISNLPYSANYDSVSKHFTKLQPSEIRVPLERDGKKGRGFAFVEFASYDRMKTCLKLYHHTMFDDGKSPARKIGVELTAGGGGSKSETRKARIVDKNKKLNEERARSAKEAAKLKRIEEKKKQEAQRNGDESSSNVQEIDEMEDIHPSRRDRFQ